MIRHLLDAVVRHVRERYSKFSGGSHINVVYAHSVPHYGRIRREGFDRPSPDGCELGLCPARGTCNR